MKNFLKFIKIIDEKSKRKLLPILLLAIGLAIMELMGVASVFPLLALISDPSLISNNSYFKYAHEIFVLLGGGGQRSFVIASGIVSFIFLTGATAYKAMAHWILTIYVEKLRHSISARLFRLYTSQPYIFFVKKNGNVLSKNVLSEVDLLVGNLFRAVFNLVAYTSLLIVFFIMLSLVDPKPAIYAVSIFGVMYGIIYLTLRGKLSGLGSNVSLENKQRFEITNSTFESIKEILANGMQSRVSSLFRRHSRRFIENVISYQVYGKIPGYLVEAIVYGGVVVFTLGLVMSTDRGGKEMSDYVPVLGLYVLSFARMKPAVQVVYQSMVNLRYGLNGINSLLDDMTALSGGKSKPRLYTENLESEPEISLNLKNISFQFPGAKAFALHNINLKLEVGDVVGIIGASGAGKTTLVDIITGLLTPDTGGVFLGGVSVDQLSVTAKRAMFGYVPQTIFIFDSTLLENITGVPLGDPVDQPRLANAIEGAQLGNLLARLEQGLLTPVGQRGIRLSGGERQRIGIARVLYKVPSIYVFDEATNALDSETETKVFEFLYSNITKTSTVIIVTHNACTLSKCNRLVRLDKGEISKVGSYAEVILGQ